MQPVEGRRYVGHIAGTADDEQRPAGQDGNLDQKPDNFYTPGAPRHRAHVPAGEMLASGALCAGIRVPHTFDGRGKHYDTPR